MHKSFLQTTEWLKFQEHAGHKVWRFDDGKIKANIIQMKTYLGRSWFYIPHGPEIKLEDIGSGLQNELRSFLRKIKVLGRQNKAIFVKMEPFSDIVIELLYRRGFRKSPRQVQPQKTVIIDLGKKEGELLSEMHSKTRYNIGLAEKKDIVVEESGDIDMFWELLKKTSEKDGFSTHPKEYYAKLLDYFKKDKEIKVKLYFAMLKAENGKTLNVYKHLAGALVLYYGNTAYYLHGAMDRQYSKMMAPYLLHWKIMQMAKKEGYENYDFWGINAKKWPGVTRFKLGWGGRTVEHPGSFDMSVSWFWFLFYRLCKKFL
jgi:lipid II:glycine glycyltransferase (peptidoglycan interpeptide bridge formation enzyme)